MIDEKRTEKLLKRAKPFLDEKLKAKQRLASLYSFMENSTEQDQAKFFQQHDYQVYTVMFDCFTHQVEKIKSREKPEKPLPITSKEVTDLFRILYILKRIALFLPEKIRSGWQRRSIVGILQTLLASTNHPKLRIEGLRILLLYLTPQTSESHETTLIYANAIPLAVFEPFPLPKVIKPADDYCLESQAADAMDAPECSHPWMGEGKGTIRQEPIEWERRIHTLGAASAAGGQTSMDKTALLPSLMPTTSYDSVDLFEEVLQHLVTVACSDPLAPPRRSSRQRSSVTGATVTDTSRPQSVDNLRHSESALNIPAVPPPRSLPGSKRSSVVGIDEGSSLRSRERGNTTPSSPVSPHIDSDKHEKMATPPPPPTAPIPLAVMWDYFKKYYLRLLFPRVSRLNGLEIADGEGFATCPPQLLHSLINFLIRNCVDAPLSPASTALRSLLLGSDQANVEMVHEWLRQAMLIPCAWSDVLRGSVGVMRVWLGLPNDDRPPFLQLRSQSRVDVGTELPDNNHVDAFARRYIRFMRLAFSQKIDDVEHMDAQLAIFHEVLNMYRSLTLEVVPSLSNQTWRTLTSTLLDITAHVLCQTSPYAVVRDPAMANEVAEYIFETVFTTWVRSGIRDEEMWRTLRMVMEPCTMWKECIHQWEVITMDLTGIISTHTYSIELDSRFATQSARPSSSSQSHRRSPGQPRRPQSSTLSFRQPSLSVPSSAPLQVGKRDRANSILSTSTSTTRRSRAETVSTTPSTGLKGAKSDTELSQPVTKTVPGMFHTPSQVSEGRAWGLEFFATKHKDPVVVADSKAALHGGTEELDDDPLVLSKKGIGTAARDTKGSTNSLMSVNVEANDNPAQIPILMLRRGPTATEFGDLGSMTTWNAETALFAWENILCVLGDLNDIKSPANHADAMRCVREVWDALESIRLAQPFESEIEIKMPPLFKFATWLFKAADLDDDRVDGRAVAYGCMCRMMCRRHDQPFSNDYYPHFYRLLVKGLAGDDAQVITEIMANGKKLFALGLPGSYILVEPVLRCVRRLFVATEAPTVVLPVAVRQDAITILSALTSVANYFGEPEPPRLTQRSVSSLASQDTQGLAPSRMSSPDGVLIGASRPVSLSINIPSPAKPPVLSPSPAALAAAARSKISMEGLFSPNSARSPEPYLKTQPGKNSFEMLVEPPPPSPISLARHTASPRSQEHLAKTPTDENKPPTAAASPISPIVPLLEEVPLSHVRPLGYTELKVLLKETLLALVEEERRSIESDDGNPETLAMLHWSITVMAFDEMMNCQRPVHEIVDDCVNSLLDLLTCGNLKVVYAAADGLTFLAQNHSMLPYLDRPVLQGIVEKLIGALTEQLLLSAPTTATHSPQTRAHIVSRLLYCLLDWAMVFPPEVWAVPKISHMVFEAIENAMTVVEEPEPTSPTIEPDRTVGSLRRQRGSIYDPATPPSGSGTGIQSGLIPRDRKSPMELRSSVSEKSDVSAVSGTRAGSPAVRPGPEDSSSGNSLIRETAENVLMHIVHHVNNFAPPHGASMLNSQLLDPALQEEPKEGERYLYLSLNGTTLITLVDMPGQTPSETRARMIIRDMTGRYTWDSHLFYESLQKMQQRVNDSKQRTSLENLEAENEPSMKRSRTDPCQYQGVVATLKMPEDVTIEERPRVLAPDEVTYVREKDKMPLWEADVGVETADMLDELLQFIGTEHPDCLLTEGNPLNVSPPIYPPTREAVFEMSENLQRQITMEQQCLMSFPSAYGLTASGRKGSSHHDMYINDDGSSYPAPHPPSGDHHHHSMRRRATVPHVQQQLLQQTSGLVSYRSQISLHASSLDDLTAPNGYVHVKPIPYPKKIPPFQRARLLLSHLGHVDFDSLKNGNLHLLAETPALYRDIKVLDRKHGRETVKLAVIYVAPGQEDEQSIFRNTHGSPEYRDFVASLGWEVDLATHPGFLGGLEKSLANGATATYYCTSTFEMLFHDVTKMPVDPTDEKQLKKKRHIGNDHVHIVWNEHHREYRRGTIGGDFGNAQLIVTPRTDGLFWVQVLRDDKIPSFGPLHGHAVVNKRILGPLVRQTALNAYRAALAIGEAQMKHHSNTANKHQPHQQLQHPLMHTHVPQTRHAFTARREDISTISDRHKVAKWTFEKFVNCVFAADSEHSASHTNPPSGQHHSHHHHHQQKYHDASDPPPPPPPTSGPAAQPPASHHPPPPSNLTRIVSGISA